MKVLPFKIPKTQNIGLIYQEDKGRVFYNKLHQHEEVQLCTIIKGEGTLIVGDTINDYKSGDVLVIGSNLPHVFKSDMSRFDDSFMISLFFTENSFGSSFFDLDDFKTLHPFLNKTAFGLKFLSNTSLLQSHFLDLQKADNLTRFICFFEILKLMTSSKSKPLAKFVYSKNLSTNEGKRLRDVMDYTIQHFNTTIHLNDIASHANMTPNAFCKYFKQRTNKTYFSFLNELRIDNACKLLTGNRNLSVSDIAFQCGFTNASHFNRTFKLLKQITPSEYRKQR